MISPELLLHILVLLPVVGYVVSLFIPEKREALLSAVSYLTVGLHFVSFSFLAVLWSRNGYHTFNHKDIVLWQSDGYEFYLDFCFDKISLTYLAVGAILTFLVSIYSRYYLHREKGYKRFF